MDTKTKNKNGVKFLLVAVDVLSRFFYELRVQPMKTKTAVDTTRALKRMISRISSKKFDATKAQNSRVKLNNFVSLKELKSTILTVKQSHF